MVTGSLTHTRCQQSAEGSAIRMSKFSAIKDLVLQMFSDLVVCHIYCSAQHKFQSQWSAKFSSLNSEYLSGC